jgi:hypothetical protein
MTAMTTWKRRPNPTEGKEDYSLRAGAVTALATFKRTAPTNPIKDTNAWETNRNQREWLINAWEMSGSWWEEGTTKVSAPASSLHDQHLSQEG